MHSSTITSALRVSTESRARAHGPRAHSNNGSTSVLKSYSAGIGKLYVSSMGGGGALSFGGGGDGGGGGGGGGISPAAGLDSSICAATSRMMHTHLVPYMKTPPPSRSGLLVAYDPRHVATPRVPQQVAHLYLEKR